MKYFEPDMPPEQLLRASLRQVLYSIRSGRLLVEQLPVCRRYLPDAASAGIIR